MSPRFTFSLSTPLATAQNARIVFDGEPQNVYGHEIQHRLSDKMAGRICSVISVGPQGTKNIEASRSLLLPCRNSRKASSPQTFARIRERCHSTGVPPAKLAPTPAHAEPIHATKSLTLHVNHSLHSRPARRTHASCPTPSPCPPYLIRWAAPGQLSLDSPLSPTRSSWRRFPVTSRPLRSVNLARNNLCRQRISSPRARTRPSWTRRNKPRSR